MFLCIDIFRSVHYVKILGFRVLVCVSAVTRACVGASFMSHGEYIS